MLLPSGTSQAAVEPARILLGLAPDQSQYDPTDSKLRAAAQLLQDALAAPTVEQEEAIWTKIIDEYSGVDANWVPDLVGRAWGNRGNARSRQGKFEAALNDYNTSISICPWSVDPVLNRGVVLEALDRYEEAEADYRAVLLANPLDPAGWNNLGNANAGMGKYKEAVEYYGRGADLSPAFSFASANRVVHMFQLGDTKESIREMRKILRKYPDFPDTRAALTAALWSVGLEVEAETNWQRVSDPRYRDLQWLSKDRRWPPALVAALQSFLNIKSYAM